MNSNVNVELILTQRCNFRCKYCYEKCKGYENQDMSQEVLDKALLYVDTFLKKREQNIVIDFWGGEPSLRPDIINYVCDKYINNPRVSFSLFTNGYNLDPIWDTIVECNKIQEFKFPIQVSYDYATQNKRVLKGGKDTSEDVIKTIKKLHDSDINFHTKSTLMYDDLDKIEEIYDNFCSVYDDLEKVKPARMPSLILTSDTMAIWDKTEEEFDEKFELFKKQLKNIVKKNLKRQRDFSWLHPAPKPFCGAGQSMFCVNIDGMVYNCHGAIFLNNKEEHIRGNILNFNENSHLMKYFLDFTLKEIDEECKRCSVHVFPTSKKTSYEEKWFNYSNREKHCRIQKEISKHMIAYNKILNGK